MSKVITHPAVKSKVILLQALESFFKALEFELSVEGVVLASIIVSLFKFEWKVFQDEKTQ